MDNQDCIYLGKILKPFSYKGELKIYIEDFYIDQIKELDSFLLKIQGSYIPFTIKAITKNKSNIFRIFLDGIDSEDLAKKLADVEIYADNNLIKTEVLEKKNNYIFIDYVIYNNNVIIGKIIDIIENENQDLFEVVFNEKRILIPLVDEFVVNIDNDNKKIIMNLPDGLTDL
ncbi:MAG: 16S rRNA processing protein RimM [Flavobacteriaceae bacterium]|nr:16S rRNA processing protein RimM [Flavobacteriaceae bacterium]